MSMSAPRHASNDTSSDATVVSGDPAQENLAACSAYEAPTLEALGDLVSMTLGGGTSVEEDFPPSTRAEPL